MAADRRWRRAGPQKAHGKRHATIREFQEIRMIVITTPSAEGKAIITYHGIVAGTASLNVVVGQRVTVAMSLDLLQ